MQRCHAMPHQDVMELLVKRGNSVVAGRKDLPMVQKKTRLRREAGSMYEPSRWVLWITVNLNLGKERAGLL